MVDSDEQSAAAMALPKSFRFSLRAIFGFTLLVAIALTVLFAMPDPWSAAIQVCLSIALPAFLTVTVIWSKGMVRAFCIGALFPLGLNSFFQGLVFFFGTLDEQDGRDGLIEYGWLLRVLSVSAWSLGLLVGAGCAVVWWRLTRSRVATFSGSDEVQ